MHCYKIEDGETHYYVAKHPADAIQQHARFHCCTRNQYCDEFPDHVCREMGSDERIEINLSNEWNPEIPEYIAKSLPQPIFLDIKAKTVAKDWIDFGHYGLICSSVY